MGDFGPAYAYAQQDPGLVCQECHAGPLRLPRSGTCPHCGTSLRGAAPAGSRGGGGGSGPDMETATLETMVPALLQRIVAPGLLEGLADYGDASAAADETAIESLETVKVEPHVRVEISHREPDRSPRDAAAHAAEARAAAAAGMDASSATDCGAGAGSGAAAAAPPLEMRGTASSFGTHLGDLPSGVSGSLVLASPRDASAPLENASELSGAVVLAWRGGCSFVDKVRRVQQAGAAACLVVQTGDKWPLSMSDSASAGGDITLPSAMLKPADGERLLEELDAARATGGGAGGCVWVSAQCVDHQTTCAVCMEELVASTLAVRLPCRHTFHEECLRAWLSKHNTCPTCRAKLPTTAEVAAAEEEREGGPPPPSWLDYPLPRAGAPPSSSSMYT
mmetsp:Transcript_1961/g.6477  ORF Transcript_1961/g.6477 Transcript_1961/m.6477 type:complete len:393 (-) Transcript_1961:347-1525(-)